MLLTQSNNQLGHDSSTHRSNCTMPWPISEFLKILFISFAFLPNILFIPKILFILFYFLLATSFWNSNEMIMLRSLTLCLNSVVEICKSLLLKSTLTSSHLRKSLQWFIFSLQITNMCLDFSCKVLHWRPPLTALCLQWPLPPRQAPLTLLLPPHFTSGIGSSWSQTKLTLITLTKLH